MSFKDRVVLVTAGAGGIGAAVSEAFARREAKVMIADIDESAGEAYVERLRQKGLQAAFQRTDATREEEVERLVRRAVEVFGGLHIAANVVGISTDSSGPEFHKCSVDVFEKTTDGCLRSAFLSCKHEIAYMIENGGGCITNVSSTAGQRYVPLAGAPYSAAKAAVIHLTKFAALSYADRGVRVNCIAPGSTVTPAFPRAASGLFPDLPPDKALEKFIGIVIEDHAIKRPTTCEDQAEAIVWLSSESAAMVTGVVLSVDGGWAAR